MTYKPFKIPIEKKAYDFKSLTLSGVTSLSVCEQVGALVL